MKKNELHDKIQLLEDAEYIIIEENKRLKRLIASMKNEAANNTEKRFRTIQRTVSRLQEEIKSKDNEIAQLEMDTICLNGIISSKEDHDKIMSRMQNLYK